ncbi:MAG: YCF48-related protein [Candidatus Binatia bacterium]
MRFWSIPVGVVLCTLTLGCHREVEMIPLATRTIYNTDKFYDVQALGKDGAIVVGYGGKVLRTSDGGRNWEAGNSGVEDGLFAVKMVDDHSGWIVGQDGLILHTSDGGKTWERQESHASVQEKDAVPQPIYLFAVEAVDAQHAWAVGDRSMLVSTADGGKTWRARKVVAEAGADGADSIVATDPVLYDVKFLDEKRGWIVGEFGKILLTTDGGETWREQQKTLMEGTSIFDPLDLPTLFGLDVKSADAAVAVGLEGHIARTVDGGQRWGFDAIDVDKNVPLVDPIFDVFEVAGGSGWAVGAAGEVMRRDPGETAWKRAKLGQDVLTWLRAVSFADPQRGWMVGGYGLIFRTTDGGKSWLPAQG